MEKCYLTKVFFDKNFLWTIVATSQAELYSVFTCKALWLFTFPSTSLPLCVTNTCWFITSSVPQGMALKKPGPIISFSENSSTFLLHSILTLNFFSMGISPSSFDRMAVTRPILQTPSLQRTETRDPIIDLFGIRLFVDIFPSLSSPKFLSLLFHPACWWRHQPRVFTLKIHPQWMTGPVSKQLISIRFSTLLINSQT